MRTFSLILAAKALLIQCLLATTAVYAEETSRLISCEKSDLSYWFPEDMGDLEGMTTICRDAYAARINPSTLNPDWVVEILEAGNLSGNGDRDKSSFKPDPNFAKGKRAELADYSGSTYDRGHQAPAADMVRSQPVMDESFYLTNMAPQVGIGFNRGAWRRLEKAVKDWALARPDSRLVVITGPIYKPEGPRRYMVQDKNKENPRKTDVRIPDSFFKIVYDTRSRKTIAFILENTKIPFNSYRDARVSIREIEEKTGYDFFPHWSARYSRIREENVANLWR